MVERLLFRIIPDLAWAMIAMCHGFPVVLFSSPTTDEVKGAPLDDEG